MFNFITQGYIEFAITTVQNIFQDQLTQNSKQLIVAKRCVKNQTLAK